MQAKLHSLLFERTNSTFLQLFRYFFVGGFAFLVDFGALYAFTEYAHLHYLISAAIGFILGLITNYLLSISWVFNKRKMQNRMLEFAVFTLIGLVGLGLNELLLWVFTDIFLVYYLVSKLITAVIVLFWNFFARKLILFNQAK